MPAAGHPFTREDLVSLKRADIQKLCKDYGVRANMKTDALIELLLDSLHSNMSPLVGPRPQQAQAQAPRRVSTRSSTRVSSLRSRGTSGSSSATSFVTTSSHMVTIASPRTNKSKLTQYRLGVGRPSAAGGSGLRNTSRSSSSSKVRHGRSSRSFRPPEATINEEPEASQTAIIADQHPGASSSRVHERPSRSAVDNNNVAARLDRLETMLREADIKRQLDSLRDIPSQVAYLKASVQQREAEIVGLRGELNVCKTEVLALRGEISKIPFLEGQLRVMKDTFDQLEASSSSGTAKGKMARRLSIPFGESNVNSATLGKTPALPNAAATTQMTHSRENPVPLSNSPSGHSEVALGKRPREANSNPTEVAAAREGNAMTQEELARRMIHPYRKRARLGGERRPLQEKVIEPKHDTAKPTSDHESGEECVGSAGSSASGPSTQPSVSTPPPAPHTSEYYNEFDPQGDLRSDEIDMLDFCQAASSTPRDDIFNFFDEGETFSQLSVTKLGARIAAQDASGPQDSGPQPVQREPRRVSTAVARPRTPTRPSGPARFRVAVDSVNPVREDIASPFDPYVDGAFGLPFGAGLNNGLHYPRRDMQSQNQNQGLMPAPVLALGYGLASVAPGVIPEDSPVRPAARTMYGTELQNDTRFGDFGRDGIAGSSAMGFWGNF